MMFRFAFLAAVLLTGCENTPSMTWLSSGSQPRESVVICDATARSSCTEATLLRLLRAVVTQDPNRTVTLYQLDSHVGARKIAVFRPTKPLSQAKKVLLMHRQQVVDEASRLFSMVIPTIFTDVPKTSPIAAAILSSIAATKDTADVYILTDGRELSRAANFERGQLPGAQTWRSQLETTGYKSDALRSMAIHFIGMPLIAPGDADANPTRGLEIQALWRELSSFGASSVSFDDEPQTSFLLIIGPISFLWRRFRVWLTGRFDGWRHFFDPQSAVESRNGPKPQPEHMDPATEEAETAKGESLETIAEIKPESKDINRKIAQQPLWQPLALGIIAAATVDTAGTTSVFSDLGVAPPERYLFGAGLACGFIALAGIAAKGTTAEGKKPIGWYLTITAITLVGISLTIVRVTSAAATGDPLFAEIAKGSLTLCTVLGPCLVAEVLFAKLRNVMPLVRRRWQLQKEQRKARQTYEKAMRFLKAQAQARHAWEHEYTILRAVYVRAYCASGGEPPSPPPVTQPTPAPIGDQPPQKVNGLPTWHA